jgi:hypothetical protein
MPDFVWFVSLKDIPPLGNMKFTKVQWWTEQPFCVCVNYSVDDGPEKPLGVRLDLDKRVFLDDLDDAGTVTTEEVEEHITKIWDLVVDALHNKSACYYRPAP